MNDAIARPKVLILGGGFGGMETATYLAHRAPDRADITLVSNDEQFLFRPNTIYIPFGLDEKKLRFPLAPALAKKKIAFEHATVREVDLDRRVVGVEHLGGGTAEFGYDYLVVATGAGMRPSEVPGMEQYAHTPWTPGEMSRLGDGFRGLVDKAKAGERSTALFLVPPQNKCSGPLYELVFMLDTWLRRHRVRDWVTISYTTYERTFIQAFGPKVHEVVVGEFNRRGIDGHNEWMVDRIEAATVFYTNGEEKYYDLLAAFPPYVGNPPAGDLPKDDRGFLLTEDLGSRRLQGHPEVFVPGDAGDFPVKQAFLAFLESDAAAEHLAAELTGDAPAYAFDPVSMCVMEQMDKAVFAQVPLALTGDPSAPIRIREGADSLYKIGSGKTWRLGKKALGYYLPFRFKAGEPFHAGAPWEAMDLSLKAMSSVLAR